MTVDGKKGSSRFWSTSSPNSHIASFAGARSNSRDIQGVDQVRTSVYILIPKGFNDREVAMGKLPRGI
jgi:hypothetical protein